MDIQFAADAFSQTFKQSTFTLLNSIEENPRIPKEVAVSIYQNNALGAQLSSLKNTFSVSEQLVGEACFKHIALAYLQAHPMNTRDLNTFAATFPSFIKTLQKQETTLRKVPYLTDIAQLEQYLNQAYYAKNLDRHSSFDTQAFSKLTDETQSQAVFILNPEINLMKSRYPIRDIWLAHQAEEITPINLNQNDTACMVYRPQLQVKILELPFETYEFFAAIKNRSRLANLCQHFPHQVELLGHYIRDRWLIGFAHQP